MKATGSALPAPVDRRLVRRLVWIGLGLTALGLRALGAAHPAAIERWYSRGLFLGVRWTIDYLLAWFPLPLIYLFFLLPAIWLLRRRRRRTGRQTPGRRALLALLSLLAFCGGVVFLFLFLWGFNYGRLPIEDQLGLEVNPLSLQELREELELETQNIIQLRGRIPGATTDPLTRTDLPPALERHLRQELEGWLDQHRFPTTGRVRARRLFPRGIFLRFSSSGLYFPFTGEGHVDAAIHPLQLPAVMAHEMGHGYGFGDEGTCNFLAFLACSASGNPVVAYAGHLSHWRTLASNYLLYQPDEFRAIRDGLPAGIKADLDAINATLRRYPDLMPELRYYAYDAYLKTQGIEEGMLNYNRVVMLVRAWRSARRM